VFKDGAETTQDAAKGDDYAIIKLAEAPKLERQLLWEAFWDLHTTRINSMALGPIPIDKMHWYADVELELDDDERRAFVWIMRRLDSHFIGKMAEKNRKHDK
jgi:hypothetical protein